MLDVPYNRFIEEPRRFGIMEEPYVPNIEVFDFLSGFIPEIMHEMHEQFYLFSNDNVFRTYLYNLVSINNFNNIHVRNIFQLIVDETFRLYQEDPDIEVTKLINRAGAMVVMGYLGLLVKDEPELMRAVDRDMALNVFKVVYALSIYTSTYKSNRERLLNGTLEDYTPTRYRSSLPPEPSNFNLYDNSIYVDCWGDLEEKYEESISKPVIDREDYLKKRYLKYSKIAKRLSDEQIKSFNPQLIDDAKEYEKIYLNTGDNEMYNQQPETYRERVMRERQEKNPNSGPQQFKGPIHPNELRKQQQQQQQRQAGPVDPNDPMTQYLHRPPNGKPGSEPINGNPMLGYPMPDGTFPNQTMQPQFDQYGRPIGQPMMQQGQPMQPQFDQYGRPINQPMMQQGQPMQPQYDQYGRPIGQPMMQQSQPMQPQYDQYGRPIGQPMMQQGQPMQPQYDQYGRPVGQPMMQPQYDQYGRRINQSMQPQFDQYGRPLQRGQFQTISNTSAVPNNPNMFVNQQPHQQQFTNIDGRSHTNERTTRYKTVNPAAVGESKNINKQEEMQKERDDAFLKQEIERGREQARKEFNDPWNQAPDKPSRPVHKVPNVNNVHNPDSPYYNMGNKDENALRIKVDEFDNIDELLKEPADVTLESDYFPEDNFKQPEVKVDRSKHKIKVLNNKIELDTPTRMVEATNTILDLNDEPSNSKAKLEGAEAKKSNALISSSTDEFLLDAVIQDFTKRNTINNTKTTVTSGLIANPILIKPKYKKYLDSIMNSKTLYGIVENMNELTESDDFNDDLKSLVLQVNSKLTIMVNSFLKYNVSGNLYIDDFSEDILNLLMLVKNSFETLDQPFREFEREVIKAFKMSNETKATEELKKSLKIPSGIEAGFFSTTATLILTPLVSEELKLPKKFDDIEVTKDTNPELHSLLTLSAIYEEENKMEGFNKFIRTLDGLIYNVYLDYENVDKFILRLHV